MMNKEIIVLVAYVEVVGDLNFTTVYAVVVNRDCGFKNKESAMRFRKPLLEYCAKRFINRVYEVRVQATSAERLNKTTIVFWNDDYRTVPIIDEYISLSDMRSGALQRPQVIV